MLKRILSLAIPIFVLLHNQTTCSSFSCENLDAAACKNLMGKLLDDRIRELHIEFFVDAFVRSQRFYSRLLEDLPDNDPHTEAIKNHLKAIDSALSTLNKNSKGEDLIGYLNKFKGFFDPDFSNISIDANTMVVYNELLLKYNFEEFRSERWNLKNQMDSKMKDIYLKEFFKRLRDIDLGTFSEYTKFSNELNGTHTDIEVWTEIARFFDTPYLKFIYKI